MHDAAMGDGAMKNDAVKNGAVKNGARAATAGGAEAGSAPVTVPVTATMTGTGTTGKGAAGQGGPKSGAPRIGAVIIGRNEGERLKVALAALTRAASRIVYVDSGSTDGSADFARGIGAEVIALDMSKPFTAARARNAGIEALRQGAAATLPDAAPSESALPESGPPDYVQFVDGDCELQPDWIETAIAFLEANPKAAVACGRRRERFPEASVYNRHCDSEWDTPVGRARACGGDALIRMKALDEVGGYDPALIAGEEPEMCVRLRAKGWEIWRLDAEMTLHDADITRFGQFWKRARRGGHAWAEGAMMHGAPPERHGVAETRRSLVWGAALPLAILVLATAVSPWALVLFFVYPAQVLRLARRRGGGREALERAALLTIGKFAEAQGVIEFHWRRLRGRPAGLIEYK